MNASREATSTRCQLTCTTRSARQTVEFWALRDCPAPFQITIRWRIDAEDWADLTVGELIAHLRLNTPVATWLRRRTFADVSQDTLARMPVSASAVLPEIDYQAQIDRRYSPAVMA